MFIYFMKKLLLMIIICDGHTIILRIISIEIFPKSSKQNYIIGAGFGKTSVELR